MKRVVNIPDEAYELLKNKQVLDNIAESIIANGTPYDERSRGEWIEDSYAGIHCSECDYTPLKDVIITINADGTRVKRGKYTLTPYCPICGAYMGGKEKKNESNTND